MNPDKTPEDTQSRKRESVTEKRVAHKESRCYRSLVYVGGEERKTPARILEEPAQPSFLASVNSYRLFLLQVHGRIHFFEFLCATRNCDSGSDE